MDTSFDSNKYSGFHLKIIILIAGFPSDLYAFSRKAFWIS